MNNKDDQNFFSTQDEYNKKAANGEVRGVPDSSEIGDLTEKYGKYINYDEDDEDIIEDYNNEPEEYEEPMKQKNNGSFFKRNNYKNLKILLISIIVAIILLFGAAVAYLFHITDGADYGDSGVDYNSDVIIEEEDVNLEAMGDVTDANSLNDFLYSWANNDGDKMHSKNVLNVLLCGVDSETGTASSGRADAIMLVSINKKTEKITLTSFFRDSYIYMDIPRQSGGTKGRYEKINAAYSLGGPATLIDTIEKNFKVEIDEYIAVDFASFKKLIDALGGVTVDVEQNEAMFIRRTSSHKNFPYGNDVKLKGSEALIYSRIRKLDSDINRTERQRKIIKALLASAKSASSGQLVNAYRQTAEFIRTGYTQSEVISLLATAVTQGWMKYEITEITLPEEQGVEMASAYVNTSSARNQWVWIVDYPICAQKLQIAVYGETNIVLESDRQSALDYTNAKRNPSGGSSSSSSSGGSSYITSTTTIGDYSSTSADISESTSSTEENPSESSTNPIEGLIPGISSGLENLIPSRPTNNDPTNTTGTPEQPQEPAPDNTDTAE
ncbi:MAG: LCP family protein [Clostridia bacterium]|nr:LCP family protein [Clostridia bacterium]